MEKESFFRRSLVAAAGVLSIGLILSTVIGAYTFNRIRSFDNALSVTGSAKTSVVSDSVKWSSSYSRTVNEVDLSTGYTLMAKDLAAVKNFLNKKGIKADEITISPVFTNQVYKYNNDIGPRQYSLTQNVTIQSKDIPRIKDLANNTQELIASGVIFSPQAPEYYYSKLAELRVSLLGDAVKDARARAEQLARSSGRRVGVLKSASSGVVQVLAPNSVQVDDYGQYDTSSPDKDIMITVRATFVVE